MCLLLVILILAHYSYMQTLLRKSFVHKYLYIFFQNLEIFLDYIHRGIRLSQTISTCLRLLPNSRVLLKEPYTLLLPSAMHSTLFNPPELDIIIFFEDFILLYNTVLILNLFYLFIYFLNFKILNSYMCSQT